MEVNFEKLLEMQKEVEKLLDPAMKKKLEFFEHATKLAAVPSEQKSVKIDGIDILVQLYNDKVSVVFPSGDMTKQYYENIDKQSTKECWYKKYFKWSR